MSKFAKANQVDEPEVQWQPSRKEALACSEKLKTLERREHNGYKIPTFLLYLESTGSIRLEGDVPYVRNSIQYDRDAAIYDLARWIEMKDLEQFHQANPEEKVAYDLDRAQVFKEVRESLRGLTTSKRILQNGIR